jgi:predicted RNA-binding protein YlxR (DUF448 family)
MLLNKTVVISIETKTLPSSNTTISTKLEQQQQEGRSGYLNEEHECYKLKALREENARLMAAAAAAGGKTTTTRLKPHKTPTGKLALDVWQVTSLKPDPSGRTAFG